MIALNEIASVLRNGKSVRQSSDAGGLPITRIETIADGTINPTKVGYADLIENDARGWLLHEGDILISHINSTKHLGKCAIYEGFPEKLVHGMNLLALRVDQRIAYPKYVHYTLSSAPFRRQLPRITKNSVNQSSFNISSFKKLRLPLPALPEQKRIAKILDAADALRAKRRESLAQLDALLQSTFLEMFGDPVENPKGWKLVQLGEITSVASGAGFPNKFQGQKTAKYPFYKVSDMNLPGNEIVMQSHNNSIPRDVVAQIKAKTHPAGTIIFPKIGAAIATNKKRILSCESCFDNNVIGVHPSNGASVEYLYNLLLLKDLSDFANTGNPPSIRKSTLEDWKLPLPDKKEQQRFAAFVAQISNLRKALEQQRQELDQLFDSLQQRAFAGQL